MAGGGMRNGNRLPVLGSVVALVSLAAALVAAVVIAGRVDQNSTPLIVTVLGIIGATVPSVLALLKVSDVQHDIRNGVLREKVREGTAEALDDKLSDTNMVMLEGPTIAQALTDILAERLSEQRKEG